MVNFRHILASLYKIICLLAAAWLLGIIIFIANIPDEHTPSTELTDAVIVLTGGSLRLEEGVNIFQAFPSKKLLISGIGEGVTIKDLPTTSHHLDEDMQNKIVLGEIASSTITNAYETKIFMELNNFRSMRLVTSSYHIPRTKLIFEHVLPNVTIIYHPVYSANFRKNGYYISPKSFLMVSNEYNKYLLTLAIVADEIFFEYWDAMILYIASSISKAF
ncbi:MAG: YdcF family protein [Candidatus Jidaibacter sp.]|jgi:uncharacterized SAM-binding protein YcdF (DUF218 family)|nr:YdcF family protein [Candidatus Jidaibacter sp.]